MLRTSRWYYEKEPVWLPGKHNRNSWFKKRTLHSEIIKTVKENPGISTGEVARKLEKSYYYNISPLLFHLRNLGSLRDEQVGCERVHGLEAIFKDALRRADALRAEQREDQGAVAQNGLQGS